MYADNLKYNYIIYGAPGYYEFGYHDISKVDYAVYYKSMYDTLDNSFAKFIMKLSYSKKVNSWINEPFCNIIYSQLCGYEFKKPKPICFLCFPNNFDYLRPSFLKFLRTRYPKCKIVFFLQDLLKTKPYISIEYIRENFDLILDYDRGDCEAYGFTYHTTPMSYVDISLDSSIQESDIYFCGAAKSRYPIIHEVYQNCLDSGLRCDFNLMQMPTNAPRCEGINYPKKLFGYMTNLQHIAKTKAIVEIMQEGADGFTPRFWESIVYDKHLFTNNKSVFDSPLYDPSTMHHISLLKEPPAIQDILNTTVHHSSSVKRKLSPLGLLKFIDNIL